MAHVMKHTKASCGHMFAHFDRKAEHISNENLDRTRTHLNYNLAVHQQMDQGEFVRKRCSEVRCQNRKDVNVMVSWVVTAPKDLDPQRTQEFMQHTYNFLEERYGKENVVSAYVHMDEVTPHMHFAFVPVAYDSKKDRFKVSAKEVINRQELRSFHNDLEHHLEKEMACEIHILNDATKGGNRSIDELKKQNELKAHINELSKELEDYKDLKITADKVNIAETQMPFGMVMVNKNDLSIIQDQAKSFVVNRNEIMDLRNRSIQISNREELVKSNEHRISEMYNRQISVNKLLEKTENENEILKEKLKDVTNKLEWSKTFQNVLKNDKEVIKESAEKSIGILEKRLKTAYTALTEVVEAVGMLKYDSHEGYKIENLNPKQERLIDGIAEYASKLARNNDFSDLAEEMDRHVGISSNIRKTIQPQKNKDYDLER